MTTPKKLSACQIIILCLLVLLILSTFFLASVPPVDRDALTHHLFIPKLWLNHGGIYEIPEIQFSYYPMNLDLLYVIPLYFGNDIVPKYIHYFFSLLTAWLLYRYCKKNNGMLYGLFAALFFLSIPIIIKLSVTAYVDLGVVFFSTASLLLLLHWPEKNFQLRFLLLSGLCCGLAAGTKYNGIISVIVLTSLVPIIYQQSVSKAEQSNCKALLYGVIFAAVALSTFSPWLIRNHAWTGNPIYPLHNTLIQNITNTEVVQLQPVSKDPSAPLKINNPFLIRKVMYGEQWWQTLLLPLRYFYEGQDDNPRFFDGKLTPFLLLLTILAFLIRSPNTRQNREKKILLTFSVLYFFFTFLQESLRIRYITPIVPALVMLSVYGLQGAFHVLNTIIRPATVHKAVSFTLITALPTLILWYNVQYIWKQYSIIKPLPFLQGKISREEYITAYRHEYPAIQHANTTLPSLTKVLCIFLGNRGYYMDFHPVFEQPYRPGLLSTLLTNKNYEINIVEEMKKRNITHVLMRDDLTATWFHQLPIEDKKIIAPLMKNVSKPLFNANGYIFFSIYE